MNMNKTKQALEDLKAWAKKYDATIEGECMKVVMSEGFTFINFPIDKRVDEDIDTYDMFYEAYDWDGNKINKTDKRDKEQEDILLDDAQCKDCIHVETSHLKKNYCRQLVKTCFPKLEEMGIEELEVEPYFGCVCFIPK